MTKRKKYKKKKPLKSTPTTEGTEGVKVSGVTVTPYPTAGAKITEFEEKLDQQLKDGEPKKRPGRPLLKEQAEEQPEITIKLVAGTIKLPFELWAIREGVKDLALTETEARQLAEPVKQLLDYYLPQIPAIAYAWITLSVSGFWIVRTRLLLIAELKKLRHPTPPTGRDETERGQGGPVPPPSPEPKVPTDRFPQKIETQQV